MTVRHNNQREEICSTDHEGGQLQHVCAIHHGLATLLSVHCECRAAPSLHAQKLKHQSQYGQQCNGLVMLVHSSHKLPTTSSGCRAMRQWYPYYTRLGAGACFSHTEHHVTALVTTLPSVCGGHRLVVSVEHLLVLAPHTHQVSLHVHNLPRLHHPNRLSCIQTLVPGRVVVAAVLP